MRDCYRSNGMSPGKRILRNPDAATARSSSDSCEDRLNHEFVGGTAPSLWKLTIFGESCSILTLSRKSDDVRHVWYGLCVQR